MTQLKTGINAIAFFSRNGRNNPIKFVLCERKYDDITPLNMFKNRPYDLIVPKDGFEHK